MEAREIANPGVPLRNGQPRIDHGASAVARCTLEDRQSKSVGYQRLPQKPLPGRPPEMPLFRLRPFF